MFSEIFQINYGKSSQADEINNSMCTTRLIVSQYRYPLDVPGNSKVRLPYMPASHTEGQLYGLQWW